MPRNICREFYQLCFVWSKMSVKGIIMFLGMNNTRLERKILIILDFENGFLPTYLPLCIDKKRKVSCFELALTFIAKIEFETLSCNCDTRSGGCNFNALSLTKNDIYVKSCLDWDSRKSVKTFQHSYRKQIVEWLLSSVL